MDVIMDVCDAITVINFGKQLATGCLLYTSTLGWVLPPKAA